MKITCPLTTCGAENDCPVTTCTSCGSDLRAYAVALRFADLCFNRGLELAQEGDLQAARREFDACLRFRPDDEEAKLLLAKTYRATGDKNTARRIWEHLQATSPAAEIREEAARCLQPAKRDKAAKKGAIKANNASRRKARASARVAAIA